MDNTLGKLAAELECLSVELVNMEAQVSKIRAEIAELTQGGGDGDEGDMVPVPIIAIPRRRLL